MAKNFHKFRAATFEEALGQVRTALGQDAVVLRTTQVKEGGFMGFLGRPMVELTVSAPPGGALPGGRHPSPVERKYSAWSATVGSDERVDKTVEFYRNLVKDAQRRMNTEGAASRRGPKAGPARTAKPAAPAVEAKASAPTPQRKREGRGDGGRIMPLARGRSTGGARPMSEGNAAVAQAPQFTPLKDSVKEQEANRLRREVRDMREMLQVLVAESPGAGLPTEFAPHYRKLTAAGFSRKVAASLLGAVVKGSELSVLKDERVLNERLRVEMRKRVKATGGMTLKEGHCKVVALVGATGVGKTTNLAKLAAQFAVRQRASVALVTADTYRVAAPEQLRVYANIIGLPMEVVNDAKEMASTLRGLSDYDLVLIDTAGGSQFNAQQIHELEDLLKAAAPDEVLLVASANTQLDDLRQIVDNFRCLDPTALLFSKLDETRRYGALFTLAVETGLPLSYLSVGQNVPDDIVLAQPAMVANLALEGRDRRGRSSTQSS